MTLIEIEQFKKAFLTKGVTIKRSDKGKAYITSIGVDVDGDTFASFSDGDRTYLDRTKRKTDFYITFTTLFDPWADPVEKPTEQAHVDCVHTFEPGSDTCYECGIRYSEHLKG